MINSDYSYMINTVFKHQFALQPMIRVLPKYTSCGIDICKFTLSSGLIIQYHVDNKEQYIRTVLKVYYQR